MLWIFMCGRWWAFECVGYFYFCPPGVAGPGAAVGRGVFGAGSGFRVGWHAMAGGFIVIFCEFCWDGRLFTLYFPIS